MSSVDLLAAAPCGLVEIETDGRILSANRAFASLVDREVEELVGRRFQELLSRGAVIFYETQFAPSLLLRGRLEEISLDFLTQGGEQIPALTNAVLCKGDETRSDRIVLAVFSARQRHLYEDELLRSRNKSEQLSEVVLRSSDAIIRLSSDARIESWNRGPQQILGYSASEALGKSLRSLFPEERFADLEGCFADLAEGREMNRESVVRHRKGKLVDVSISMTPHMEAPGILVGFSAIIRDITRTKQAEAALLQTEKLASVGRLASSIAHEINNPLESVTNLLFILRSRVVDDETRSLVQTAEEELARVSQIANHTLRFHKQSTGRSEVKLHSLVESVLGLYRARLQNSAITVVNESTNCSPLFCYENELRQVLLNLVANSFDAMRSGGRLTIRCRDFSGGTSGNHVVRISVSDTGSGMDQPTLVRIFEPFFSTKGIGGTGLGLWISKDLISRNGGSVRVRSSRESGCHGTTCLIWFPDQRQG